MTRNRAATRFLVIHCSATPPSSDIGAREIDRWHRAKGWLCIGYHYVVRRDGTVEAGRPRESVGAHAEGVNAESVGVCLVGGVAEDRKTSENNFTAEQLASLAALVRELRDAYPDAEVVGHRDLPNVRKACPSFDARAWWQSVNP